MSDYIEIGNLRVAKPLYDLVQNEITPGTHIEPAGLWHALWEIVRDLEPKNKILLDKPSGLQGKIDAWHRQRRGQPMDAEEYKCSRSELSKHGAPL